MSKNTYYSYDFSKAGAGIAPSVLKKIYVGDYVDIGRNSFSGNAKLQVLELGTGTTVGDYAFMNSAFYDESVLQEVDLSGVVSIGEYAFSGTSLYDYQIIKYNNLGKRKVLKDDEIIYIEPKKNKAMRRYKYHTIQKGETLSHVSRLYAVKLKSIFKMNDMDENTILHVGDNIRLR